MSRNCRLLSMVAGLCVFSLVGLTAVAQENNQQETQQGDTTPGQEISDTKLEKAVEAYLEIRTITDEFEQSVQKAQDSDQRQALQTAANKKAVQAIENAGLEVETYTNIMDRVRTNDELAMRFIEKMKEVR